MILQTLAKKSLAIHGEFLNQSFIQKLRYKFAQQNETLPYVSKCSHVNIKFSLDINVIFVWKTKNQAPAKLANKLIDWEHLVKVKFILLRGFLGTLDPDLYVGALLKEACITKNFVGVKCDEAVLKKFQ